MSGQEPAGVAFLAILRRRPDFAWLIVADLGLSAGLISFGLSAIGGYAACHLCIAQRALLLAVAPVALLAAIRFGRCDGGIAARLVLLLALAGLAVALFQSLVERRADLACDAPIVPGWLEAAVLRLGEVSPFLFGVDGACGAAAVGIAGITLANLGVLVFAAMLAAGVWAMGQARRLVRPPA